MPAEVPGAPEWHRTLAPLHNLTGPAEPVVLRDDLSIQPFAKDDREALARSFGDKWAGPTGPITRQSTRWTHVVDLRWDLADDPTCSQVHAEEAIEDAVRALRLHRAGLTGTTILWTRPNPPDPPDAISVPREDLSRPHGAGLYMHPLHYELKRGDRPALRKLFGALRAARANERLQLALRRFDAAYARYEQADSLVDLWVAFEALLLPDRQGELRFRAALRIAQLVGTDSAGRRDAFDLARTSYEYRSKLVHGESSPDDLGEVVEQTRNLARKTLRIWILEPPRGGVNGLDDRLLA